MASITKRKDSTSPLEDVHVVVMHSLRSFAAKHPAWPQMALLEFCKTHRSELVKAGALLKLGSSTGGKLLIIEDRFVLWVINHGTEAAR